MSASDLFASAFSGLQTVSDVASPVGDYIGGKLPPVGIPGGPPDPAEMLNQIALDKDLFDGFAPVLFKLGYAVEPEVQISDRFGYSRSVTLAKFGDEIRFYLVVIPKPILENSRQANLAAIGLLEHMLFARGSRLYVISRDLSDMDDGFDDLMNQWDKFKVTFVRWSLVNKFLGEKDEQRRNWRMRRMLELEEAPVTKPEPKPVVTSNISTEDEQEVIRIMVLQAASPLLDKPQDYFTDLALKADLPQRAELAGRLKGNPEGDARMLVQTAKTFGYPKTHPRAGQKQIGWVLRAMINEYMLDESQILTQIILKNGLITDAKVLEELQ